jgi:hypothetical protein
MELLAVAVAVAVAHGPPVALTSSVEGALLFKCARILSITVESSMQEMICTCPAHRSQI